MGVQTITLQAAYMIENLRKQGISNEKLFQIDEQAVESWQKLDDRFDFTVLKELAEADPKAYASIIRDGYQVKFLTINGLINLIQLKFDKERDVDFTVHDDGISNLSLDISRHPEVKQFISQNWKVTEEADHLSIRSVHS